MPPKKVYIKKDPISHILDRSDMYVGSKKLRKTEDYIAIKNENEEYKIIKKEIVSSPAILRIFVEILSNAIDNVERSRKAKIPCTMIKVNIDKETGETSVWNDGDIIPIEINDDEKVYNHSLIFGNLMAGSNFDDTEERIISGRNGLGSTLCNVFSNKFIVKGLDPHNKKVLEQVWTNNMRDSTEPKITDTKLKTGFTKITYFPDFKQFDLKGYTVDIINLYTKYVIDAAMLTKVKVYLNEELIPVNDLISYSKFYESPTDEKVLIKNKNSEVLVTTSDINEFQAISFVNGVYTRLGGVHVDAWSEEIFRPLVEKFNKKGKPQVNIKDIKQFFKVFIVSTIINPEFSSQDKERCEAPKLVAEVKQADINKILKWSVITEIEDIIKMKEMSVLKKSEKKKKGYTKIEGLDQANNAGGKLGYQCTLILCEGLSAKTYAVAGIEKGVYGKSGRDWFGILPLRGKCLSPETKIITWDGKIKKAKDIKVGEFLINEKGEKTEVLKLYSGEDKMYEIQQNKGINYIVNSMHTLSLKLSGNNNITWSNNDNAWNMIYYDIYENKAKTKVIYCKVNNEVDIEKCIESGCIYYNKSFSSRSSLTRHYKRFHNNIKCPSPKKSVIVNNATLNKDEGYIKMCEFRNKIKSPDIIDIDIDDYLKIDNNTKHLLKGFKLETYVDWKHKDTYIDPYILGMWLGDGFSNGYGFAGEDVELINEWYKWCNNNNCEIVHNNKDDFIIRKKNSMKHGGEDKRIPIGTSETSNKNCRACNVKLNYACSNDDELISYNKNRIIEILYYDDANRKYGLNPLKEMLNKYNLINNKHIPDDYIFNDKETRLKILAGFIDTDGYVCKDGRIEIVQSIEHKNLIESLYLICKSLGFYCNISKKTPCYIYKGYKKYSKAVRLYISGNGIKDIPTILLRKKLTHIFSKNSLYTGINIVNKGVGPYVGFMTDKTHRFLLHDFTVTHNCLNVRNSIPTTIAKNAVITDIIQALGLRHDLDYTDDKNYKTLSYGKVMLLTDSDVDGLHISSLIMNFFHSLFPTLLDREDPFIISMATPIVRVFNQKGDILFYDENKFREFAKNQTKSFKSKYYKGLGTTKIEDVTDTFGSKMIEYTADENININMNKAFHKKYADTRKEWLENYDPNPSFSLDDEGEIVNMEISQYLNTELIKFSHDDCKRSIPSLFDGLKQSQRKVLFSVKKRNLTYNKQSLKVAQLGGYVAEHTNYHHGEQNLYDTIIKMANEFPGSNNIPLLYRDGAFGTRLVGSKDAASARYIFTKMEPLTPLIFREEDDVLLEYVVDDGDVVEPKFYLPIIPMILVNGACGIGSGWSCLASKTPVLLWNGNIKTADNIKTGDILIGDDGTPRNVLNTCSGEDEMYEITQSKGNSYTVNSNHILTFVVTSHKSIYSYKSRKCWAVKWWDNNLLKIRNKSIAFSDEKVLIEYICEGCNKKLSSRNSLRRHTKKFHPLLPIPPPKIPNHYSKLSSDEAKSKLIEFLKTIPDDNKIDIKISDYMKLSKREKKYLLGFTGDCVQWPKKEIPLDPYILGMWLGDGSKDGYGFSADPDKDQETIKYWEQWACSTEKLIINIKRKFDYKIKQNDKELNSFRQTLKKLNLINNKHIPKDYLINDRKTRLALLAGLIDTDGCGGSDNELLFSQSLKEHEQLINDTIYLAKSLGFSVISNDYDKKYKLKSGEERVSKQRVIRINGDFSELPMLIKRKIRSKPTRDTTRSKIISIKNIGKGSYNGFSIDGNKRFLLGDFTVTHNCNIPCYNPLDIVDCVKTWLEYDGEVIIDDPDDGSTLSMLPEIKPWYRGFEGTIESDGSKFISYGVIKKDKNKVEVTELPIGLWTDKFKETCEDWLTEKQIKAMKNNSTPKKVKFLITESDDGFICNINNMKLYSYLHTTNMVLFNEKEQLKKYTTDQIINDFCKVRYEYYIKRKNHILNILEKELKHNQNKARFIQEIIDKKLNIMNIDEEIIIKELEKRGYDKELKKEPEDGEETTNGYNYLLKLQVRTFTSNKVKQLKDEITTIKNKIDKTKNTSEKQMWLNDLEEFQKEYNKWLIIMDENDNKKDKKNIQKTKKRIV